MLINSLYGGDYLKATDLQGQSRVLTIAGGHPKEFDDGKQKFVLEFEKTSKTLVLNATNANMISDVYGGDTDVWIGKQIELRPERVNFAGKMVDAIRVYPPNGARAAPAPATATGQFQAPAAAPASAAVLDDDLPF